MWPPMIGCAWGLVVLAMARSVVTTRRARRRARRLDPIGVERWTALRKHLPTLPRSPRLLTEVRAARRARVREAEQSLALPVTIDLLVLASTAGLTPYLAIEHCMRWSPPALAGPLAVAHRQCRMGLPLVDALVEVGRRHAPLQPVSRVLVEAIRTGAPAGPLLSRVAEAERLARRQRSEERARRMSVRLLFPLVFLVLPAFGLLVVVPALIRGLQSVGT